MKKFYKYIKIIIKLLITSALIYIIVKNTELKSVINMFGNLNLMYSAFALLSGFIMVVLLALRLSYVAGASFPRLIPCITKCFFFNNLFPAQIGGDLYKIYHLTNKDNETAETAISKVAGDRLVGITGLLIFAIMNLVIGRNYFSDSRIYYCVGTYLLIAVIIFLCIFLLPEKLFFILKKWEKANFILTKINTIRLSAGETIKSKIFLGIILTLLAYTALILVNIFSIKALGIRLNIYASIFYIPVITIAVITLPISFNGHGIRESLFIVFFGMAKYSNEESLAMALMNLTILLIISIIGGLLLLFSKKIKK